MVLRTLRLADIERQFICLGHRLRFAAHDRFHVCLIDTYFQSPFLCASPAGSLSISRSQSLVHAIRPTIHLIMKSPYKLHSRDNVTPSDHHSVHAFGEQHTINPRLRAEENLALHQRATPPPPFSHSHILSIYNKCSVYIICMFNALTGWCDMELCCDLNHICIPFFYIYLFHKSGLHYTQPTVIP